MRALLVLLAGLGISDAALAEDDPAVSAKKARALDRIDVAAPRLRGLAIIDTPASLSVQRIDADGAQAEVSLAEALGPIPGLLARERQNYAQDTQLAIRGFGARSTFGVRGLRLYADGIPASFPDGQGQISHFVMAAGDRVEVLRGPLSALYGNASGGVLQFFTADPLPGGELRARSLAGADGQRSHSLRAGNQWGAFGAVATVAHFRTDGLRPQSAAERDSGNLKLLADLPGGGRIALVGNHLDLPEAQDPLGLSAAELATDRFGVTAAARQFNTRKSVRQTQIGLVAEQPLPRRWQLRLAAHRGQRDVNQVLAVPVAAQGNPLSGGGVIDLANTFDGADLRLDWRGDTAGIALGLQHEDLDQDRRGFENFLGSQLGVAGRLRRDERNRIGSDDLYAQGWWQLAPRWSLLAGVRDSEVDFASVDRFITAGNPDDSGRRTYTQRSPTLALGFAARDDWRWHLAFGRGFETPTFNELAYRADGGSGLALDLAAVRSRTLELGSKWRHGDRLSADAALFQIDSDDELAVARNIGGRSSFRNIGPTRRRGAELALAMDWTGAWRGELALTWLQAQFRRAVSGCSVGGCTGAPIVLPGAPLPGIPPRQAFLRLTHTGGAWRWASEVVAVAGVTANDAGSARTAGYALLNMELARVFAATHGRWRAFARLDNLLDQAFVGSVIVNEGNGRFFEPGPGRALSVGLQWDWQP